MPLHKWPFWSGISFEDRAGSLTQQPGQKARAQGRRSFQLCTYTAAGAPHPFSAALALQWLSLQRRVRI